MVSTKQKHDLKFEQNPSLWMAIKSSYYTRAVWVKVKRERKKKDTNLLRVRETDVKY